jgi:hypothetical protein
MGSPHTPEQDHRLLVPDTEERAHFFWHVDTRRPGETMAAICAAHGIGTATGYRWRQERAQFSDGRRVRKRKAAAKHHKLGRPWRCPLGQIEQLCDDATNLVRDAPIEVQVRENNIPLADRSLRYNLAERVDAQVYAAAYSDDISDANKRHRVHYGGAYEDEPVFGFWDTVYFTDEAHFNPTEDFQKPRILRRRGERLQRGNVRVRKTRKATSLTLHMYAAINWYFKSELNFYNDEKDMLKPPKPPPKPRKSKYESPEQYHERVKQWEATKPPPLEVKGSGHHMTQQYYATNVLPTYIRYIHQARLQDPQSWLLQEDGDPSHGTKSKDNVAENTRQANWIPVLLHPAQSPDLNPIEGLWLVLKQRAKRRLWYPEPGQRGWDGSQRHLKEVLKEVWASITMSEVRDRIVEMPHRCHELTETGGEKIRSETW